MMRVTHKWYEAELNHSGLSKGRLSIYYRDNGNGHTDGNPVRLDHSFSVLERVFTGEFPPSRGLKSSGSRKIKDKYRNKIGPRKIPQNLAYLLLTEHPTHYYRRDFNFGKFIPISEKLLRTKVEQVTSRWKTKGFSREDELYIFRSSDFHRTKLHKVGREVLESNSSKRSYKEEVMTLLNAYKNITMITNAVVEANMGLAFKLVRRIHGPFDYGDLIDAGLEAIPLAVERFDCAKKINETGKRIKFSTFAGNSIMHAMFTGVINGKHERRKKIREYKFSMRNYSGGYTNAEKGRINEESLREELVREIIKENLAGLSERELYVIKERYGFEDSEKTLKEVGDSINVQRERVRQIQAAILKKIAATFQLEYYARFGEDSGIEKSKVLNS